MHGLVSSEPFAHRVAFGDSTVSGQSQPVDPTVSTRAEKEIKTALFHDTANDANGIYEVRRGIRKAHERRGSGHAPQRRDRFESNVGMTLNEQYAAMIQATLEEYEDALLDPENNDEPLREEVRRFKKEFYGHE